MKALIFVYNADMSLVGIVTDFVHRAVSPETYPCNLCDLTYDRVTMKRSWKDFISTLPVTPSFLLRNQFRAKFPAHKEVELPAAFTEEEDGSLALLISAEEMKGAETLEDLEALVRLKVGVG